MKPVYIRFTDDQGKTTKTYSTCSLKTGIMDNFFEIAEKSDSLEKENLPIQEVREFFKELKALIVEIFGGQFTYDELNKGAEITELIKVFKDIGTQISGEFIKN